MSAAKSQVLAKLLGGEYEVVQGGRSFRQV